MLFRSAAALVLVTAAPAASQATQRQDDRDAGPPPPQEEAVPLVTISVSPRDLLDAVPARLDLFPERRGTDEGRVAVGDEAAVRAGAAAWINELLAPLLDQKACRALLPRLGIRARSPDEISVAAAFPGARPIAAGPDASRILVPESVPAVTPKDLEFFRASGLLPFEVSLTGEWARQAAARHAGPVPRDPLLRSARAARLEGVARLAGLIVTASGTNVDPVELGQSLLALDQDRAGWPRDELAGGIASSLGDPVSRALLKMFVEDGVRWALMHYLRGGPDALAAALERPGVGPEGLLRPGARRRSPGGRPPGCRLGPRGAAALLLGEDDPIWVADLVEDSFVIRDGGSILGWLGFESAGGAKRAADDLAQRGLRAESRDAVVVVSLDPR